MKVGVGADYDGFEGYQVVDFGDKIYDGNDDYPASPSRSPARRSVTMTSRPPGVEDDNLDIICFGGRSMGIAVAWDCAKTSLTQSSVVPNGIAGGWLR